MSSGVDTEDVVSYWTVDEAHLLRGRTCAEVLMLAECRYRVCDQGSSLLMFQ